jgi:hypothetical protein
MFLRMANDGQSLGRFFFAKNFETLIVTKPTL